jgi:hypothetical protein
MRSIAIVVRASVALLSIALLGACNESQTASKPSTSSPTAPSPPSPPSAPASGYTLSGVVYENSGQGKVPRSQGRVRYYAASSLADGVHGSVELDANGRYVIPNLPRGHRVKLGAYVPMSLGQPCAAHARMDSDSVLDVELVRPGARPTTQVSPTLSGIVFAMTAGGLRPAAGEPVSFYGDDFQGMVDVLTWTDGNGRYEFCGLPLGTGHVGAGDCNDTMLYLDVTIPRDTKVDIDLTSMVHGCPGARQRR